jgi:hypothetical protein
MQRRRYGWLILAAAMLLGTGLLQAAVTRARICFEAEGAESRQVPFVAQKVKAASEGKCLAIAPGAGCAPEMNLDQPKVSGEVVYHFRVTTAGKYYFWARTWWDDGCGNSFKVYVDKIELPLIYGEDATYDHWHWPKTPRTPFTLSKGTHTLRIANREDGIKIDQICWTTDPEYVPGGGNGTERVTKNALVKPAKP